MNAADLIAKGYEKQQDGSWRKPDCPVCAPPHPTVSLGPCKPKAKRVRQSPKPLMNKLEAEWFAVLQERCTGINVRAQAKRYRLGNGVHYTPDFTASGPFITEQAWEVKGKHSWDDAMVKIKMAATVWPEVRWILVWKENGEWKEQTILP